MSYPISDILIDWYKQYKRALPWRETKNAYIIWISEVILQQTRVNQGLNYFLNFIKRFPDVQSLAEATEDEVMKYWQGLGYYSRARNLQSAAKEVMSRFNGIFPVDYKDVLSLKGVGEYTAAAICSFAYDAPYAVVDGNVFRVLSRLFALETPIDSVQGKKTISKIAQKIMPHHRTAMHNQAIMEFGALQCTPQSPDCFNCPLSSKCLAFAQRKVSAYPIKAGKIKPKDRYFNYFYIYQGDYTFLRKRVDKDIWRNLYEFPLIETSKETSLEELSVSSEFKTMFSELESIEINLNYQQKHVLSHQIIHAKFYRVIINENNKYFDGFLKIPLKDLDKYAISRLIHKYLEKID